MISKSDFLKNFGKYLCPKDLMDLLEFQNRSNEWYCRGFELTENINIASTYSPRDATKILIGFARDRSGSEFAFWANTQNKILEDAPIVYLDSEGYDNRVIAKNLREFLGALTLDQMTPKTWVSRAELVKDRKKNGDSFSVRAQEYRKWLQSREIDPIDNPKPMLKKAEAAFPGFQSWLHPSLQQSCKDGDIDGVKKWLEPLSPNAPEITLALLSAIEHDHVEVVKILISHGVEINQNLAYGNTALSYAAGYLSLKTIQLLLSLGANPTTPNEAGNTPLDLAQSSEYPASKARRTKIVSLLSAAIGLNIKG